MKVKFKEIFKETKVVAGNSKLPKLSCTIDGIKLQSRHFNKSVTSEDTSKYLVAKRNQLVLSPLNLWLGGIGFQDIVDEGILSPAYKVYSHNHKDTDSDFIKYFVKSDYAKQEFAKVTIKGASIVRRNLDKDALKEITFQFPDKLKQKSIAEKIQNIQNLINVTNKKMNSIECYKKSFFKELISEKSEVAILKDVVELINGNSFKADDWREKGLPIIRIQNLNGSREFNYYDKEPLDKWIVDDGDLLFAWSGQRGKSFGARIWRGARGVLNQHIFNVKLKDVKVLKPFLYYCLLEIQHIVEQDAHGFKDSFMHVKKSDLESKEIPVPPIEMQEHVISKLKNLDNLYDAYESKLKKLKFIRKAIESEMIV